MRELHGQRECRGDLVARERRGELSSADRIALGVHLETCNSCRMTRDIRADFEAETAVEMDDAVRIARLSSAARRWSQRRARPRLRGDRRGGRWHRAALGVVGLLMLAGSASATAWWWRAETRAAEERVIAAHPAPARQRIASAARRSAPSPAPVAVVVAEEPEAPAAPVAKPASRPARPRVRAPAAPSPREGPAALLRRADGSRRRGESEGALALYRRLQAEYPDTREAVLSTVPLGGILLRQGQASRAVEQFDRYLSAEPHGNLIPEALYGRGRGLASVGQREAERQTWRRLIDQSPGSAYEPHARRRLAELQ